jgi:hypothetical protein
MLERLFGRRKATSTQPSESPKQEATQGGEATDSPQGHHESVAAATPNPESSNTSATPSSVAPELEKAMAANVAMDSVDTRLRVYQELLFSELLLAVPESADGSASEGLSVAILKNPQGVAFAVAFTGEDAVRRWRPDGGQFVRIKGLDLFKVLDASPAEVIVVNPASVPFIVLPKVEYRQLALGVVPQSQHSPVQNPSPDQLAQAQAQAESQGKSAPRPEGRSAQGSDEPNPSDQIQVAFPPDVFNEEQASFVKTILLVHRLVEAAVFGALKPPGSSDDGWMRTIFVRTIGISDQQAASQLTAELKATIQQNASMKSLAFEVGIMGDPQFWLAMHQNNLVLFDKQPPKASTGDPVEGSRPGGVADADEGADPATPVGATQKV